MLEIFLGKLVAFLLNLREGKKKQSMKNRPGNQYSSNIKANGTPSYALMGIKTKPKAMYVFET